MAKLFHGKMNRCFSATTLVGLLLPCILMLSSCVPAAAQRPDVQPSESSTSTLPDAPHVHPDNQADEDQDAVTLGNMPLHILKDQAAIWTSPARIRTNDLVWLVPLAGATGAAIATDHHTMSSVVSHNPSFNQPNIDWSNG